jgi:hypothetical protein
VNYQQAVLRGLFDDGVLAKIATPAWCDRMTELIVKYTVDSPEDLSSEFWGVTLPSADNHLLESLEQGAYTAHRSEIVRHLVSPRTAGGPGQAIFRWNCKVKDEACTTAIAFIRQVSVLFKKVQTNELSRIDEEVLSKFERTEADLLAPSEPWDANAPGDFGGKLCLTGYRGYLRGSVFVGDLGKVPVRDVLAHAQHAGDILSGWIGSPDPATFRCSHGPGAVAERESDKYSFKSWPSRLDGWFPISDHGYPNYDFWIEAIRRNDLPSSLEVPARLTCVPKDLRGPRLIAIESAASQFAQQAIWRFLANRVGESPIRRFIDFKSQVPNQDLARQGSFTGDLATVDLADASDRVSLRLVERIFRANPALLQALEASRTPAVKAGDVRVWSIRKYATMGNATTFPVESLVFLALAFGALAATDGVTPSGRWMRRQFGSVRVFGDDIVVPVRCYNVLSNLLGHLDLKVNKAKSFSRGRFRESCGLDAYAGENVTPVYVRRFPSTGSASLVSVLSTSNQMHRAGWWIAAQAVVGDLELGKLPVTSYGCGHLGIRSFSGPTLDHLPKRWNKGLQRNERRVLSAYQQKQSSHPDGSAGLLRFFTEAVVGKRDALAFLKPDRRPSIVRETEVKLRSRWVAEDELQSDSSRPGIPLPFSWSNPGS